MDTALLDALMTGHVKSVTIAPNGTTQGDAPPEGALLSGAFNPLHQGHEGMLTATAELTGLPVAFELAVVNADKGALAHNEVVRRAGQFSGRYTLLLSRAPLFVQKAHLYPGRLFILGYDTAARLVAPRYYGGEAGMLAALGVLRDTGCGFLVAGRLSEGRFYTLADLPIPASFATLFTPIPEANFRADVSSTELRAHHRGAERVESRTSCCSSAELPEGPRTQGGGPGVGVEVSQDSG
jgi:hypothetical protein